MRYDLRKPPLSVEHQRPRERQFASDESYEALFVERVSPILTRRTLGYRMGDQSGRRQRENRRMSVKLLTAHFDVGQLIHPTNRAHGWGITILCL